jgi:hypothetical protein
MIKTTQDVAARARGNSRRAPRHHDSRFSPRPVRRVCARARCVEQQQQRLPPRRILRHKDENHHRGARSPHGSPPSNHWTERCPLSGDGTREWSPRRPRTFAPYNDQCRCADLRNETLNTCQKGNASHDRRDHAMIGHRHPPRFTHEHRLCHCSEISTAARGQKANTGLMLVPRCASREFSRRTRDSEKESAISITTAPAF